MQYIIYCFFLFFIIQIFTAKNIVIAGKQEERLYPLITEEITSAPIANAHLGEFLDGEAEEDVVKRALGIILPSLNQEAIQEAQEIRCAAFDKIKEGSYKEAINILIKGLVHYPQDCVLQTTFAAAIGDYAGNFSGLQKEKMLQKSRDIFDKLHSEIEGQPPQSAFLFKNEYCYRFGLYKEQYENGEKCVEYAWTANIMSDYGYRGYYFQGVGAANHAKQLLLNGDKEIAREYAEKALVSWSQYFSYYNKYYNAYVHYGLALGILGYKSEMMRTLQHAADLINSDMKFHEIKEVIEFFDSLQD